MAAWLLPLASFAVISIGYSVPQLLGMRVPYSAMKNAAYIAVAAIVTGFVLSCVALFGVWLPAHPLPRPSIMRQLPSTRKRAARVRLPRKRRTTARRRTTPAIGTRSASSASSSSRSAITSIR